jgi:hypothetical protein
LGIERKAAKIRGLGALGSERKGRRRMLRFLTGKRMEWESRLESSWNNRSLEDLMIFKQGGRKIAGGEIFTPLTRIQSHRFGEQSPLSHCKPPGGKIEVDLPDLGLQRFSWNHRGTEAGGVGFNSKRN